MIDSVVPMIAQHRVLLNRKWIPAFLQAIDRVSREDHRR
jgi:hypothetical protein